MSLLYSLEYMRDYLTDNKLLYKPSPHELSWVDKSQRNRLALLADSLEDAVGIFELLPPFFKNIARIRFSAEEINTEDRQVIVVSVVVSENLLNTSNHVLESDIQSIDIHTDRPTLDSIKEQLEVFVEDTRVFDTFLENYRSKVATDASISESENSVSITVSYDAVLKDASFNIETWKFWTWVDYASTNPGQSITLTFSSDNPQSKWETTGSPAFTGQSTKKRINLLDSQLYNCYNCDATEPTMVLLKSNRLRSDEISTVFCTNCFCTASCPTYNLEDKIGSSSLQDLQETLPKYISGLNVSEFSPTSSDQDTLYESANFVDSNYTYVHPTHNIKARLYETEINKLGIEISMGSIRIFDFPNLSDDDIKNLTTPGVPEFCLVCGEVYAYETKGLQSSTSTTTYCIEGDDDIYRIEPNNDTVICENCLQEKIIPTIDGLLNKYSEVVLSWKI